MENTEDVYFLTVIEQALQDILAGRSLEELVRPMVYADIMQGINIMDIGYPLCSCFVINRCINNLLIEYCNCLFSSNESFEIEGGTIDFADIKEKFWGEGSRVADRIDLLSQKKCHIKENISISAKKKLLTQRYFKIINNINLYAIDFMHGKTEYEGLLDDTDKIEDRYLMAKDLFISGVRLVIMLEAALNKHKIDEEKHDVMKWLSFYKSCTVIVESEKAISQGTAFHIGDGRFVTCYHVVYNEEEKQAADDLTVYSEENVSKRYTAIVEDYVEQIDIAILKVNGWEGANKFSIQTKDVIRQMDEVIVLGYPNYNTGDSIRVIEAKIASTRNYSGVKMYGIDNIIYVGNSGGPVLTKGERKVIGIVTRGTYNINTAMENDFSGFIPISALNYLNKYKLVEEQIN